MTYKKKPDKEQATKELIRNILTDYRTVRKSGFKN